MADADKTAFIQSLLSTCREKEIAVTAVFSFRTDAGKARRQVATNVPDQAAQAMIHHLLQTDGRGLERAAIRLAQLADADTEWGQLSDERRAECLTAARLILTAAAVDAPAQTQDQATEG